MHILHYANCWQQYLEKVIVDEVTACTNEATLFRGNSLGIASLRFYIEYLGRVFLQNVLSQPIKYIITSKLPCNIKNVEPEIYKENIINLKNHLSRILETIIGSASQISTGMKYLFYFLRAKAEEKFGKNTGLIAVSGFLFLRFIVPALHDPQTFGIWSSDIEPEDKLALNFLSSLIQKIANLNVKFRPEDPYAPLSDYINEMNPLFLKFIEEISDQHEVIKPKTGLPVNSLIAYDAACLVHFFNHHTDYYNKFQDDPSVIYLQQILEPINQSIHSFHKD